MRKRDKTWREKCKKLKLCVECGKENDTKYVKCRKCTRWHTVLWHAEKQTKKDFK